jgi:hypothetical protein
MSTLANYPLESMVVDLSTIEAEERAAIQAEKEAKEHRKAVGDRASDARDRIRDFMLENGVLQDTTPQARVSIVKTPSKLKIDDPEAIPDEFFELEPSRNDAKIKARIASGISVPGARLEQSETLKVEWKR